MAKRVTEVVPGAQLSHRVFLYADTGCYISPTCLACPLEVCVFDLDRCCEECSISIEDRHYRAKFCYE